MNIGTMIYTWLKCKKIGIDQFRNSYYISRIKDSSNRFRRSVIYANDAEATNIPVEWYSWLHYMNDTIPDSTNRRKWQKERLPNQTGTGNAYLPSGHLMNLFNKKKFNIAKYNNWKP